MATVVDRSQKFSFLSICGIAITTGESWIVLGNSLTLAIANGGPAAVLYGFITDSICYWIVAASIAELASSMPSTATAYRWAYVTGGRYGHYTSWYAGWWSFAAWQLGVASYVSFMSLQILGMYETLHPAFVAHNWERFITYMGCNWLVCLFVLFEDNLVPLVESFGLAITLGGWFISIVVVTVMPHVKGAEYATNNAVWVRWQNSTGWSDGFAFCLGMLNAAYAVCAPDITSHLAEEIPRPKRNIPVAIFAQYVASFATGLIFLVAVFYATANVEALADEESIFPLALVYRSATSPAATVVLLVMTFLTTSVALCGTFAIAGRQGWGLARAGATPYSAYFVGLNEKTQAPFRTIAFVGCSSTLLGCLYLATPHAFDAIAGSFVVFTSLSYLAAVAPHLLSARKNVEPGTFWMPWPVGMAVNTVSVLYLTSFGVIFCMPQQKDVTAVNMNYTSVVVVGWTVIATGWLGWSGKTERRPESHMSLESIDVNDREVGSPGNERGCNSKK